MLPDSTSLHGPKRIYYGKGCSFMFWTAMVTVSAALLITQVTTLASMYLSHPTVSEVSFIMKEEGIELPVVTLCNFNPMKKSYVKRLNMTGDLSEDLLDYLVMFLLDATTLYFTADRESLHMGQKALDVYQKNHPNFTVRDFFINAGFLCEEVMKICTIGGQKFDCCRYMKPTLTNLGMCHSLDLRNSRTEWMREQKDRGVTAGLQLVLDAHLEELFGEDTGDPSPPFTSAFESGFRYYVHAPRTVPYFASEGISVSPSMRVYSALSLESYFLLPKETWGNCSSEWPSGFNTSLLYTSENCNSLCKANYFYVKCGCTPFTYDIENERKWCTPFETVRCFDDNIRRTNNGVTHYENPRCDMCKTECESQVYHAYNSYGSGFSHGALTCLHKKNRSWDLTHMRRNFLAINIFFRDMFHTEYVQQQATTLAETLSDIGGNMGLFLGMSVITIAEVIMYISKVGWITISKKRRDYMYQKKEQEQEQEKQLEETLSGFKMFRTRKIGAAGSIARPSPQSRMHTPTMKGMLPNRTPPQTFLSHENDEHEDSNSVVKFKIDLSDIQDPTGVCQMRASDCRLHRSYTMPNIREW